MEHLTAVRNRPRCDRRLLNAEFGYAAGLWADEFLFRDIEIGDRLRVTGEVSRFGVEPEQFVKISPAP